MILDEILLSQKQGSGRGIASICSAHPWVLRTAMQHAVHTGAPLLIESTCNQVNQFGGYTGMTPANFASYVYGLAAEIQLPPERLFLGGDHLGPSAWQNEPADSALTKAADLVAAYVRAGYTKIHLDASMKLADDDPTHPLALEVSAQRTAFLARAAEESLAHKSLAPNNLAQPLRYVVGTEVPVPGGAPEYEECVQVTRALGARDAIEALYDAFQTAGLAPAWERVIALVVQPGVEFGDDFVLEYQPEKAEELVRFIETQPRLVYEAHSTDYQTRSSLRRLVRDHFAILKVGPALTFAFREAAFALALMEDELAPAADRSQLLAVLEAVMLHEPRDWQKYYHGTPAEQAIKRRYSLSDRLRYYWPHPRVQAALQRLLDNLGARPLPLGLLSQFAPRELESVRNGEIPPSPQAILLHRIEQVLADYTAACAPTG